MQTKESKPTNNCKITHIKMWIGPKMLPSRLIVQKDEKRFTNDNQWRPFIENQQYKEGENLSYEIGQSNLDEEEKKQLQQTKEQYKKDNGKDVNFVIVDYQETLKKECEKFAEQNEDLIFVYDSSWFDEEEKQKMQAFLKELPDNCYAIDGKDVINALKQKLETPITTTPADKQFDSKLFDGGKKWYLTLSELTKLIDNVDNEEIKSQKEQIKQQLKDLISNEDVMLSDAVDILEEIINKYKTNKADVKNNKIVPIDSIGNIVDIYRMILLANPKLLIDLAKNKNGNKLESNTLSNAFLCHDFDIIFTEQKRDDILKKITEANNATEKGAMILLQREESRCDYSAPRVENGVILVKYNNDNKNKSIDTLLANYIKFYKICTNFIINNNNNKFLKCITEQFNKCSIYEFLCQLNDLNYNGFERIYKTNCGYDKFPMIIDEQHRSWFTYSKDLSKNDEKHEEKEKDNNTNQNESNTKLNNTNQEHDVLDIVDIKQLKNNVRKYIDNGVINETHNIVEDIKKLSINDDGKEFLRNCHCNIALRARAKREHQVFLTYEKIQDNPSNVNELVSMDNVKSWNMCGCSCC